MSRETLRLLAAKDLLGFVGPEAMSSEATNALLEGIDSPSIRQLAGLRGAASDEARDLLQTALRELDIESLSSREAAFLVATEVAKRITEGTVSPYDGAREIWHIVGQLPLEHLPEFDAFVYGRVSGRNGLKLKNASPPESSPQPVTCLSRASDKSACGGAGVSLLTSTLLLGYRLILD